MPTSQQINNSLASQTRYSEPPLTQNSSAEALGGATATRPRNIPPQPMYKLTPISPEEDWAHEQASEMMFDDLVHTNSKISLPEEDVAFVKDLIRGSPFHSGERCVL